MRRPFVTFNRCPGTGAPARPSVRRRLHGAQAPSSRRAKLGFASPAGRCWCPSSRTRRPVFEEFATKLAAGWRERKTRR